MHSIGVMEFEPPWGGFRAEDGYAILQMNSTNGAGDLVARGIDAHETHRFESKLYQTLLEADREAKTLGRVH
mgnify:CR=1 FL=1|jgi:hypothetical protein